MVQSRTDRHQGNSDLLRVFQKAVLNKFPPSLNYYSFVLYTLSIHTQRDTQLLRFSHSPAYADYQHFKTLLQTLAWAVVRPARGQRERQNKKEDEKGRTTKSHLRS